MSGGEAPFRWQQASDTAAFILDVPAAVAGGVTVRVTGGNELEVVVVAAATPDAVAAAASAAARGVPCAAPPAGTPLQRAYRYTLALTLPAAVHPTPLAQDASDDNVAVVLRKVVPGIWPASLPRRPLPATEAGSDAGATAAPAAAPPPAPLAEPTPPEPTPPAPAAAPSTAEAALLAATAVMSPAQLHEALLTGAVVRGKSGVLYDAAALQAALAEFVLGKALPVKPLPIPATVPSAT